MKPRKQSSFGRGLTRRRVVQLLAMGGVFGLVSLAGLTLPVRPFLSRLKSWLRRSLKELVRLELETDTSSGRLREEEIRNIVALAEVLLPADESPGASEDWVRDYVRAKTENEAGYFREYQNAARLLDRMARETGKGQKFWQLPSADRNALLESQFGFSSALEKGLFYLRFAMSTTKRRFYSFVFKEIISDFYGSPDGWLVVGYRNYPGVPGDPRGYTQALEGS